MLKGFVIAVIWHLVFCACNSKGNGINGAETAKDGVVWKYGKVCWCFGTKNNEGSNRENGR